MISKQDMVAARTPADLERRYNFRKSFGEAMNLATDARKAAEEADRLAQEAKKAMEGLDQEEVFRILTNDGENKGIYRDENGEIYINASYIVSGILASKDGGTYFDLENGVVWTRWESASTGLAYALMMGYQTFAAREFAPDGTWKDLFSIKAPYGLEGSGLPGCVISDGSANCAQRGLGIIPSGGLWLGASNVKTDIEGSPLLIQNKTVSWKDNGDGTYTLIGTD